MSRLLDMVQHISARHCSRLDRIMEPLVHAYGVNAHAYYQVHVDGSAIYYGNFPEISEYYFSQELYRSNPFLKHPDHVSTGCILLDTQPVVNYREDQRLIEGKFNLNNLLLVLEREGDVLHAHGFGTTHRDPNIVNVYLNEIDRT